VTWAAVQWRTGSSVQDTSAARPQQRVCDALAFHFPLLSAPVDKILPLVQRRRAATIEEKEGTMLRSSPPADRGSALSIEISTTGESPPTVGGPYAYYVLGVLFVVYIFNFIDRQILAILLQPIKEDLAISDTALGFLTGFAFAVFYAFAGLPLARLADRWVRRSLIAISLATWSVMTAASGLARGFIDLALARIGVGIGEAGATPPAHSLLSDYFPPEKRATVLALYACGVYVGVGIGLWLGGGSTTSMAGAWPSWWLACRGSCWRWSSALPFANRRAA
jgi:hypothetical protein